MCSAQFNFYMKFILSVSLTGSRKDISMQECSCHIES